jgi:hypothetical protein
MNDLGAPPATRLFAPSPAVRIRAEPFAGTPFPRDEPAAANPPFGACIDYALAAAPAGPITLVVKGTDGREIRKYSSADRPSAPDPKTLGFAPEWVDLPSTLAATAGLHRFVWPLRYAAPPQLSGGDAFVDGVWAPPGRYTIELTVDGKTLTQPLDVTPDPRVRIPAAAYAEQFRVAGQIEAAQVRVASALQAASKLQAAVTARRASGSPDAEGAIDAFQARLTAVLGDVPATNPSSTSWMPPRPASLRFLSASLDALDLAVLGADAAPSPDARTGLAKIEAMIPAALASWDRLRQQDLDGLNTRLTQAGQPPLVVK